MRLILILAAIYGFLSILASIIQIKKAELKISFYPPSLMLTGGLLLSICSIIKITNLQYKYAGFSTILFVLFIAGLLLIQISAFLNGRFVLKKLHIRHHIIRFLLSSLLLIIYIFS